jgi:hypothetical protein
MSSTTSLTARRRHLAPARSERTSLSLSPPIVVALFATAVVGLAKGAVAYSRRSSVPKAHVRGTNCVTQEICIAVAFFIVIVVVEMRRRQHGLPRRGLPRSPGTPGRGYGRRSLRADGRSCCACR